jgi:hypothetical protein
MVRGIERRAIFRDDEDRDDFVARLAALAEAGAWTVYAWALLPNHAHLLVRTRQRPLPRSMRSLLTGYAGGFNRRHRRAGHLFQHLNPLRGKVVADLRALDRYPWTGHSALLGHVPRPWQATAPILAQFGPTPRRARAAYRTFVAAGIPRGHRPEFQGGGLVRSLGGWAAVVAQRRTGPPAVADARILGAGPFVEAVLREAPASPPAGLPRARAPLAALAARVAAALGVPLPDLLGAAQTRAAVMARQLVAYVWVEHLGRRASDLARALGQSRGNVSLGAKREAAHAAA